MSSFRIHRLESIHLNQISDFFFQIEKDNDAKQFHPHSFTDEYARKISNHHGNDIYLGMFNKNRMIGYGMLRGWDAGYQIPSLGIYIAKEFRGRGISKKLIYEMHNIARKKGAAKIMLKVYPDNDIAKNLYTKIGYEFNGVEDNQLVGYYNLTY